MNSVSNKKSFLCWSASTLVCAGFEVGGEIMRRRQVPEHLSDPHCRVVYVTADDRD